MTLIKETRQKEPRIQRDAILEARSCLRRLAEKKIEKAYRTADWLALSFIFFLLGLLICFVI